MNYKATVIADSINPVGNRLVTLEVTYPRFIHSEMLTHRLFSRNSASSRAIPVKKMHENIAYSPVIPVEWGKNQPGMQATERIDQEQERVAQLIWLKACEDMLTASKKLAGILCVDQYGNFVPEGHPGSMRLNVHKQIANRLTEPWMWITVIISATNFSNFFAQRCHKDAQPEIQKIAYMMRDAIAASYPKFRQWDEWHLPYLQADEKDLPETQKTRICIARCARVSYLTHDGVRDHSKDLELFERLKTSGHFSPFEHVAIANNDGYGDSNFEGWRQFRKFLPGERR